MSEDYRMTTTTFLFEVDDPTSVPVLDTADADLPDGIAHTTGVVAVGASVRGEVSTANDRDAYAVELEAGRTYRIDLEGSATDKGTLADPLLRWLRDDAGKGIVGTSNDNGGEGANARQEFTPEASGTYYISARAKGGATGTYTLSVTDVTPEPEPEPVDPQVVDPPPPPPPPQAPEFGQSGYTFELAENADGGTDRVSLGSVSATDPENAAVSYSLEGGNDSGLFTIDASSGELFYTGTGEDYESDTTQYVLTVRASDGEQTTDTTVTVNVTDVDEAPAFASQGYTFELAENADGSTDRVSLGTVAATDPENAAVSYSLEGGNESGSFTIDASSGELFYTGTGEDFESDSTQYVLTVRASDGAQTTDTTVTVNVTDVDEAPAFGQSGYTFELAENADGSTDRVSLGSVSATDPENAAVSYTLEGGNESGSFAIDASSGELFYTGTGEDFESDTTQFVLTVRASDGAQTADTTVSVNVTDVVEAAVELPALRVADASAYEGDDAVIRFRVTLDRAASSPVTVDYETVAGTATAGADYTAGSGTLTFAAGETEQYVEVAILDDTQEDDGETFMLVLSDPSGATLDDAEATGTIRNSEASVSEPSGGDLPADTTTTGVVAVGSVATGNIGGGGDTDWFAVTLEAGKTYRIDLKGSITGHGTLSDPYLRGIHDAGGTLIGGTADDDGGIGLNSRRTFTPSETGTYYLSAGAYWGNQGTYTLEVTQRSHEHPGDTTTTATVAVGGSATGEIDFLGDRDWFAVTLEAGATYRIDLEGSPTGAGTVANPFLFGLYDASGRSIADTRNDNGGIGLNSRLTFTANVSGTHYVEAGETSPYDRGTYRVSVTKVADSVTDDFAADTTTAGTVSVGGSATGAIQFARDHDWFAVNLEGGKTYRIDLEGSQAGAGTLADPHLRGIFDADGTFIAGTTDDDISYAANRNARVDFTPSADGTYYIAAGGYGSSLGTYRVSVSEATDDYTADTTTTGAVAVNGSATGDIEAGGDRDWFAVELEADKTYWIDLKSASAGGTLFDPYLRGIHDADGNLISGTTNDTASYYTVDSRVTFTPSADGTYYIAAGGRLSGDRGTYEVSVTEETDDYAADTTTAGTVSVDGSETGDIESSFDRDWFAITLVQGKTYKIDMEGVSTDAGSLLDPFLGGIYDADGTLIDGTANDDGGAYWNSCTLFTPSADGTYYVEAGAFVDTMGTYRLSVADMTDGL